MPRHTANWDPAADTRVQQTRCEADAELAPGFLMAAEACGQVSHRAPILRPPRRHHAERAAWLGAGRAYTEETSWESRSGDYWVLPCISNLESPHRRMRTRDTKQKQRLNRRTQPLVRPLQGAVCCRSEDDQPVLSETLLKAGPHTRSLGGSSRDLEAFRWDNLSGG